MKEITPFVSVIIPTFNRKYTILKAINSVLSQTYNNFELIIVDDASTDGTDEFIASINDTRIKYVKNITNMGACASRNIGIELAKGEYIAFNDSDDIWHIDKLQEQIEIFQTKNVDIVCCAMLRHCLGSKKTEKFPEEGLNYNDNITIQFLKHNRSGTQTIIAKRECFDKIKFDIEMPRFQEWELMIRLSKEYKIYYIDKVLVDYFLQRDSISSNHKKGLIAIKRIYEKNKYLIEKHSDIHFIYLATIAEYLVANKEPAKEAYKEVLNVKFDMKILIKYFLCLIDLQCFLEYRWNRN